MRKFLLLLLTCTVMLANAGVKLHTIGDSTQEERATDGSDYKRGWTQMLKQFIDASKLEVNNRGKSGTASNTYMTVKGYWDALIDGTNAMQSGDILIIQFAHNDEQLGGADREEVLAYYNSTQDANAAGAVTDARGTTPYDTYKKNLKIYIDKAKEMGVKPVLVGAICRSYWDSAKKQITPAGQHNLYLKYNKLENGVYTIGTKMAVDDHSMDYTYQMEQLANEYTDVPFINLTAGTKELYEQLGYDFVDDGVMKHKYGDGRVNDGDGTHPSLVGATLIARKFAQMVKDQAAEETNEAKKAILQQIADAVVINNEMSFSDETVNLGEAYLGTTAKGTVSLNAFGLDPSTGSMTVTADNGFEISIDGTTYATTVQAPYGGGTLIQTIYIRQVIGAPGTINGTLTASDGNGHTATCNLTCTGKIVASGVETSVVWPLSSDAKSTATTVTAADEELSNLSSNYKAVGEKTMQRLIPTTGWPGSEIDWVDSRYVQFKMTVPADKTFYLDKVSFNVTSVSCSDISMRAICSTDPDFATSTTLGDRNSMSADTPTEFSKDVVKTINGGESFYVRIYPWKDVAAASGKYIGISDMTIHGTLANRVSDAYTFGIGRNIKTAATETTGNVLEDGQEVIKGTHPEDVNVTQTTTCDYANSNKPMYHGSKDLIDTYSAANSWRNMLNQVAVNGAFNEGFYGGFSVEIPNGKVMNISQIFGDFVAEKNNYSYKFEVVKDGATIYESTAKAASNIQTCGAANVSTTLDVSTVEALQNLKGTIEFRMPWWIASSAASGAILDFNVTATFAQAAADPESPVFTTQPTATAEVMKGKKVDLSVEAEHAGSFTWYQAASATPAPETDTELGKGKTYSFSNSTPGTYYVYCRAYNEDATGEKYANSNMATITVKDFVYPLTVTWDFTDKTDQDYFTNQFAYQRNTGSVHSDIDGINLTVDATSGKFSTQGRTNLAQINQGTKLQVPVGSTDDVVKVTVSNGAQVTVGGELVTTSNEFTHQVYKAEAVAGYVEIVCTNGGYMSKTQAILSGNGKKEDRQATVTYYDVDGTTSLGTVVKTVGDAIGTTEYSPNVPDGYTNNGWVDVVANAVPETQVVAADMGVYPYITKLEDGKYIIPAGNGRQLYNTIRNAEASSKFYLANGTYDLGTACRTELKAGYVLLGESTDGVKVVNHPTAPGIQATSTFRITGDNVYIQKMTLRSDVSYSTSSTHGVGVALEINGDKSICNKVNLECNQDTYYSNVKDTYVGYFKGGRIEGTVDFICGGGNMWFEGTTLYCNQRYSDAEKKMTEQGDVIAAPATGTASMYGYVFNNGIIDGADCQAGNYSLARGWQNSPAFTVLNTTYKKVPGTKGYTTMGSGLVCRFHEYNVKDASGNAVTGHSLDGLGYSASSDAIYITADEAAKYTYTNVLGGWDPEATIKIYDSEESAIDEVQGSGSSKCSTGLNSGKYILNGKFIIVKDGNRFNAAGQQVK